MHHSLFFHGLSSFFSVSGGWSQGRCSQQTPSPPPCRQVTAASSWCVLRERRARDGDEVRLLSAVQLSSPPRSRSVVDCSVQPLRNKPCAHSTDSAGAERNRFSTSRSDSPWSAFNSASARFTVRANDLPRWATSFRSDRSDSVSSTLYLMAGISRHGLTKGLCTSLINFSYYINTLWNRY